VSKRRKRNNGEGGGKCKSPVRKGVDRGGFKKKGDEEVALLTLNEREDGLQYLP